MQHITALPQPLLELVLIPATSTEDKRALRQTCKLFKQTLDNNITCLKLFTNDKQSQVAVRKILQHAGCMHTLRAVILTAYNCNIDSLCKHLPVHITSLTLRITNEKKVNLENLRKLPQLTSLNIRCVKHVTGMEYISGLTRLECDRPVGSLAHLAPSLQHLSIGKCEDVIGLVRLTKLEYLKVADRLPVNFFQTHSQLPLKHLRSLTCRPNSMHTLAWCSAPTTLTRLTWCANGCDMMPGVLPTSITHLQLMYANCKALEQIPTALPWLRSLDVDCVYPPSNSVSGMNSAFGNLSKLTNLQCLGVGVLDLDTFKHLDHQQVLKRFPDLSKTSDKDSKLSVISGEDELDKVFGLKRDGKSVWAHHG